VHQAHQARTSRMAPGAGGSSKAGGGQKKKAGLRRGSRNRAGGVPASKFEMPDLDELFDLMPQDKAKAGCIQLSLRFAALAHFNFEWHDCPNLTTLGEIKCDARGHRHDRPGVCDVVECARVLYGQTV